MNARGLTLVEVLVAIAILAIVSTAVMSFLPMLTRNTQASTLDTIQSQQVMSIFERTASSWSNEGAWKDELVDGAAVADVVNAELGPDCGVVASTPTPERKRLVITCTRDGGLPALILRAEFGDPNA